MNPFVFQKTSDGHWLVTQRSSGDQLGTLVRTGAGNFAAYSKGKKEYLGVFTTRQWGAKVLLKHTFAEAAKQVGAPELAPPDWHSAHTGTIGLLGEVPEPWVWRWPNAHGVRRDVTVDVLSWVDYTPGAIHHKVTVRLEDNQVWHGRELAWLAPRRGSRDHSVRYEANVLSRLDARRFAEGVLLTFFNNEGFYRIRGPGGTEGFVDVLAEIERDA